MMTRVKRFLVIVAGLFALVACVGSDPVPEDRFYRLPLSKPEIVYTTPILAGSLNVQDLRANSLLRERAILYIKENFPLEIQRYHYHFWSETPPDLVKDHLLDFLERSGMAGEVVRAQSRKKSNYLLTGRLMKFERFIANDGLWVRIKIELSLEQASDRQLLFDRVFERNLRVDGTRMHQTVEAFGQGLEAIYREFVSLLEEQNRS